mmetsp:Transcript_9254/g.21825  ORF Transcript_9254/g.21825 Transcript_9254/m.21825 type:complete len:237 (-) Transcript_9254:252-962(-)
MLPTTSGRHIFTSPDQVKSNGMDAPFAEDLSALLSRSKAFLEAVALPASTCAGLVSSSPIIRLLATRPMIFSVSDTMRLPSSIFTPFRLADSSFRFCSLFFRSSCATFRALPPSLLTESSAVLKCLGAGGSNTSTSSNTIAAKVSPARKSFPPSTKVNVSYNSGGVPTNIVASPKSDDEGISTPLTASWTQDSGSSVMPDRSDTASLMSCTASSRVGATTNTVPSSSMALVTAGRR